MESSDGAGLSCGSSKLHGLCALTAHCIPVSAFPSWLLVAFWDASPSRHWKIFFLTKLSNFLLLRGCILLVFIMQTLHHQVCSFSRTPLLSFLRLRCSIGGQTPQLLSIHLQSINIGAASIALLSQTEGFYELPQTGLKQVLKTLTKGDM